MKLALIIAAVSAAWLIPIGVRRAVRRFKKVNATFDTIVDLGTADDLAFDEAEHVKALAPKLTFVPDGFTCLECHENPALPLTVWYAGCNQAAWDANVAPSEPIDGGKR